MTDWQLDHGVIAVRDLATATDHYRELGFSVTSGGTHPGGWTHNALIAFADGFYLELLAPTEIRFLHDAEAIAARNFLFALAGDEGGVGLSLSTHQLPLAVAAMQARGIAIDAPRPGGRMRPDGVRLDWLLAMPGRSMLPFFIQDVTPRVLRVPGEPAAITHANGARGIDSVILHTAAPAEWDHRISAMLGRPSVAGAWKCGPALLRVAQDEQAAEPGLTFILRGSGASGPLDRHLSHGADVRFGR